MFFKWKSINIRDASKGGEGGRRGSDEKRRHDIYRGKNRCDASLRGDLEEAIIAITV